MMKPGGVLPKWRGGRGQDRLEVLVLIILTRKCVLVLCLEGGGGLEGRAKDSKHCEWAEDFWSRCGQDIVKALLF